MQGTVTISIEIELSWGNHDLAHSEESLLSRDRRSETKALERLLSWFEEFSLPITFDVVGHLLHRHCSGNHGGPHHSTWFDADPGTNVDQNPHFYAPDLVEMIAESTVSHEITTHSYSHVLCEEHSPAILDWELCQVKDLHDKWGIERPRTFIPPRHQQPPKKMLFEHGIQTIRMPFPEYALPNTRFEMYRHMISRSHPLRQHQQVDSLLETYCTPRPSLTTSILPVGQRPPPQIFRLIPTSIRQKIHVKYMREAIDRAASSGEPLHLWTHLYNLSNEHQLSCIRKGLEYIATQRDNGRINVRRMNQLSG